MRRTHIWVTSAVLAFSLAGGAGVSAAPPEAGALTNAAGERMNVTAGFAGSGDLGYLDGDALKASFRMPEGVAVAPDGTVVVSDTRSHLIRTIADGKTGVRAGRNLPADTKGFPGGGWVDGSRGVSLFDHPSGLAVDAAGTVYVADTGNHVIRKISASGNVTTLAGDGVLGRKDGKGGEARFYSPKDVAVTADGTVYAADTLNHSIRKITKDGSVTTLNAASTRVVEVFPGKAVPAGDYRDGKLSEAKFNEPSGLALDAKGNLYVSDTGNQRIRYIDLAAGTVTTVAGGGSADKGAVYPAGKLYVEGDFADGKAAEARFDFPAGLTVDPDGGVLIADTMNHSVRYLKDGRVTTLAGSRDQTHGELDGIEGYGAFNRPTDVALLPDGSILVADTYNNRIRIVAASRLPEGVKADGGIHVVLNGKAIAFEQAPEYSPEGRTMVPLRAIAEAAGYEVTYSRDGGKETVGLKNASTAVEMTIGRAVITRKETGKSASDIKVDSAPYIKYDLTYVPVRFFAENLGLDVQWDEGTSTAVLRSRTALVP